jgi:hypothetical protein
MFEYRREAFMCDGGAVLAEIDVLQRMMRNLGRSCSLMVLKKWLKEFTEGKRWPYSMLPSSTLCFMANTIDRSRLV